MSYKLPGWIHSQHACGGWICAYCQEHTPTFDLPPARCPSCGASAAPGSTPGYDYRCTCLPGNYAEGCPVGHEAGNHRTVPDIPYNRIDSFRGKFAFLSNFYPVIDRQTVGLPIAVLYDGILYPTSEHAFAAAKTLIPEARAWVGAASTPGEAKARGRQVPLRPSWDDIRRGIMFAVCLDKFARNRHLGRALIATGNAELVEGNTWGDTYWGVCNGRGQNVLGSVLTDVRAVLRGDLYVPDGVWPKPTGPVVSSPGSLALGEIPF